MIINTLDPVTRETRELIRTCDLEAITARCRGFQKIAAEYARLRIDAPSNLLAAIDDLRDAVIGLEENGNRYAAIEAIYAADELADLDANTELWEG